MKDQSRTLYERSKSKIKKNERSRKRVIERNMKDQEESLRTLYERSKSELYMKDQNLILLFLISRYYHLHEKIA